MEPNKTINIVGHVDHTLTTISTSMLKAVSSTEDLSLGVDKIYDITSTYENYVDWDDNTNTRKDKRKKERKTKGKRKYGY